MNGAVSKTVVGLTVHRGFESLPSAAAASNRVLPALIRRRPLSPRDPPHAAAAVPDLDDELVAVDTDGRRLVDVETEAEVIGLRLLDGEAGELGVAGPAGRLAGVGGRVV